MITHSQADSIGNMVYDRLIRGNSRDIISLLEKQSRLVPESTLEFSLEGHRLSRVSGHAFLLCKYGKDCTNLCSFWKFNLESA